MKIFIHRIFIFLLTGLFFILLISCGGQNREVQTDSSMKHFNLEKGINLSHWLSQVGPWMKRDTFITESDIQRIADFGFDHVRIPIDEEELWTLEGKKKTEAFNYLKSCLDWCAKYNLKAVVDLHILRSHHFNALNDEGEITLWKDTVAQDNFIKLWEDLSGALHSYPLHMVGYEIMNEPVADDPEDWNKLIARAVSAIRKLEPQRTVIIGSNRWQTAENFPFLKVPENDTNIILAIHTYDPITVTHYKASWNPMRDYFGPISYPGVPVTEEDLEKYTQEGSETRKFIQEANKEYNPEELERILMPAITRSKELGLPLYCGEFGCLPSVPREMRLQYYRDITSVFNKHGIGYAAWDYKGDFGIVPYDRESTQDLQPDTELIKILTGSPEGE